MLSFRPHTLRVVTHTGGGYDEMGQPIADNESVEEVPCRIEPNGSAQEVYFDDGVARNYSFTVYLDQDCREFHVGEKVRLVGLDGLVENDRQFEVKGFFRNQLNARLWV